MGVPRKRDTQCVCDTLIDVFGYILNPSDDIRITCKGYRRKIARVPGGGPGGTPASVFPPRNDRFRADNSSHVSSQLLSDFFSIFIFDYEYHRPIIIHHGEQPRGSYGTRRARKGQGPFPSEGGPSQEQQPRTFMFVIGFACSNHTTWIISPHLDFYGTPAPEP